MPNTSAWIVINLKQHHHVSAISFEPNFKTSENKINILRVQSQEGEAREFDVGRPSKYVTGSSILLGTPLPTKTLSISGISSSTFEKEGSRFGYTKLNILELWRATVNFIIINLERLKINI